MNQYIGKRLGSYQLLEQVGKGGMATIYKAYQPSMDRYVAVKILPSHFTEDESFVARFTQEARTLARLEHPHILPVHDYGEQEGITYLVMRYIDAGTLKGLIAQQGPLELNEAARILDQVGRALGYAHSQGVVHRDIKPTNVLIDQRGDAFLMDFGIAKLVAGASQFTATGAIVGTPAYMSPEQGLAEPVDHRSDIYSLGVVLYEMVTGRVPFEAETPLAVLLKHVNDPLPPPRQVKPDLPESVERVILKAMAKSPEDRFQTAEEMMEALQKAVDGIPTEVILSRRAGREQPRFAAEPAPTISVPPPEPVPEPAVTAPARKPLPWLPIAGGVAALAVLLIAALLILPNLGGGEAEATPTVGLAVAEAPAEPVVGTEVSPAAAEPAATSTAPPAAVEPAATSIAPTDQHTIVFQQGVSPTYTYDGATDAILARDFITVNVGRSENLETFFSEFEIRRSLMRWDLSALPGGVTISGATVELYRFGGEAESAMEIALYRVTSDWTEGTNNDYYNLPPEYVPDGVTWLVATASVAWTTQGGDHDTATDYGHGPNGIVGQTTLPAGMGEGWVRLDATAAVRAWVEDGVPNYGLLLRPQSGEYTYHYFRSRDYGVAELRSRLVVTYTGGVAAEPAPGTGQLSPGWTNYASGNFVRALARQNDYLWVGGSGGLVRWDLNDGSYVKLGVDDGLPSNQVNDLLLDEDGNLWVATNNGLSRFDGETWLTFDQVDGLDSDHVETLFLDNDGALWAGAAYGDRGLNYYDGTAWGPPPIPPLPLEFPKPQAFALDQEGGLFVGLLEKGLAYFDGNEWQVFTSDDGLPSDQVYDLLLIDDGELLVGFDNEVVRFDLEAGDWEIIPQLSDIDIHDYRMHQAKDSSLWFFGGGGAVRYDPETGDWQRFEPRSGAIPDEPVASIIEDEGGLWIGTDGGGVVRYDGTHWETWVTDDELGGNNVWAVRQDGSGALWFAHDDGDGLSRYDPADEAWQTFGDDEGALDWPNATGIDGEGHLWIGGYEELKWNDGRTWQSFAPGQLAGVGTIHGVAFGPDDSRWLRTETGLIRHDPATDEWITFTADDHPALEDVQIVYVAGDGTVWAGGDAGLVYYGGSGWRAPDAAGDAPERDVDEIAEAPDGGLWVVADGALYNLSDDYWTRFKWPDGGWIETMAIGPDGAIWVGHDGLGRFDPLSGAWQTFTTEDGLVNYVVRAIYVTTEGVVWVGTEGGVSRYVPEE